MSTTLLLLLFLTTAFAATHVNISIAQHSVTNPADVTYVDGKASADLKAGPSTLEKQHMDFGYNQERSAKLQAAHKNDKFENGQEQKGSMMHLNAGNQNSGLNYDGRLGRVELAGSSGHMQSNGQQGFNGQSAMSFGVKGGDRQAFIPSHRHQNSQVRQANEQQEKQNQEFERYIQNYHSGPTVQTVYESASPSPQRYTQTSSSSSSSSSAGPQRVVAIGSRQPKVHTFERLVAVPSIASALLPSTEDEVQTHTIVDHQPKPITEVTQQTSSSSSSTATTTNTVGPQGSHNLGAGGIYDQANFDQTSYNKPNYDQPQFSYDGGPQPNDFHNQYLPPSVNEPQGGYGGYYGPTDQSNYYGQSGPSSGYLPSQPAYHQQQRPIVTKTIQIAQPALKAKKFEVRHPAIQKEFYDIEERVVIKPAGTIVVELDHPVSKVAKGETIVPLHSHRGYDDHQQAGSGQTHFANSGPYGQSGQTYYGNPGSYGQSVLPNNNQYSPSPVYNPNPKPVPDHPQISSTTIASSIAASPTYDQSSKGDFVEAKLNGQFSAGEPQFVSATERTYSEGKDETDQRPAHVEVNNNGEPPKTTSNSQLFQPNNQQSSYNYNANSNGNQASFAPNQPQMQANYNGQNNQYRGEYFTGEYYNNANNQHQQDSKPARLQERPLQDSTKVMKHEHNIHLPPVQHNIYLGHMEENLSDEQPQKHQQSAQLRSSRYEEEAARVLEIKPYLQRHNGPVMVYASTKVRPAGESQRYMQSERSQPQMAQYHGQLTNGANTVQYSAPYSNMRYHPEESARYTYGDNIYASDNFTPRDRYNHQGKNKENLIRQQKTDDSQSNVDQLDDKSTMHHTHIQIKVPQHAHEPDQRIMVASTISPPQDQSQSAKYRHSSTRKGADSEELERFDGDRNFQRGDQEYGLARSAKLETKPDCDQTVTKLNGHYESIPLQEHEKHLQPDYSRGHRKFMRLIEAPTSNENTHENSAAPPAPATVANIQPDSIDLNLKSTSGHVGQGHVTPGSRVIAATPAPTGASASSETFHKRRIVVNHPFQTVREVVEHEPYTNYHQVQVNEPASPAHYQQPYYHQTQNGALRQVQPVYQHSSSATHGNLQYAIPVGIPVQDGGLTYHHHV